MNRLFKKIALRVTLLFVAVIAVTSCVSYIYINNEYLSRTEQSLLSEAKVLGELVIGGEDINSVAYAIDEKQNIRVTLIDYSGKVLLDTEADISQLDNHSDRPEIQEALQNGEGINIRYSDTLKTDLMYAALSVPQVERVIRLSMPLEGIAAYSKGLWTPLIIMLALSFLLCLAISLLISRNITVPIARIKQDAGRIAHGEYESIQRLHTDDEIEDLSAALSDMSQALKHNFNDITEKNSRLQAVFSAVPGGILAIDNRENITMVNPAAKEMFSIQGDPEGMHFMEAVKHAKLEAVIRETLAKRASVEREITLRKGMQERFLQVFAVPVMNDSESFGVILLAQDITRIRKLENMRSEFAANVSHELKTPLTVISGFIDTLKGSDIPREDAERFLEIISLESERLKRLIDDVLALSEIENTVTPPAKIVDVREGVREAAELLENKARDKRIALTADLPAVRIPVAAEDDRIKQMMINLIDNAIKYTPENGSVHVSVSREGNTCLIRVSDTGIGIPPEYLPRLFERFYRVDKSRSRALGGTGLGLAIVKHIVSLLGGYIHVQSEVGVGTQFEISLPTGKRDI
jgi:two-component system, OmpR family, phosphate regulon sensor histidine kinase PhoR